MSDRRPSGHRQSDYALQARGSASQRFAVANEAVPMTMTDKLAGLAHATVFWLTIAGLCAFLVVVW